MPWWLLHDRSASDCTDEDKDEDEDEDWAGEDQETERKATTLPAMMTKECVNSNWRRLSRPLCSYQYTLSLRKRGAHECIRFESCGPSINPSPGLVTFENHIHPPSTS